MGSIRVVKTLVAKIPFLSLNMGIFFMDIGGLGKSRLLLMYGLGYENSRIIGSQFQKQRRAVPHHGDKLFIPHPRGIK